MTGQASEKPPAPGRWPLKAYANPEFLNSPAARLIRVLCEFQEPERRFRDMKVRNTVCFFGSSRIASPEKAAAALEGLPRTPAWRAADAAGRRKLRAAARRAEGNSRYYSAAMELAGRITRWSRTIGDPWKRFVVCSGGGPGIMEAANRGAIEAGGPSIGLNISLPEEQAPNDYQTRELAFEFHYFFVRKFWFFYLAKGLVIFPGGFGTFDEFFELATLVQTRKTVKRMPIVVFGSDYWNDVLDLEAMADWGVIGREDLEMFHLSDDVDEAFGYLKKELTRHYLTDLKTGAKRL